MEPYIRLNTELRKRAASDFEKNFFKLMNNSVFVKTIENLRNRTTVRLVRANKGDKLRQEQQSSEKILGASRCTKKKIHNK